MTNLSPLLCGGLIGYRALQRAAMPEKGRLLLVGFGSSAHIVIQIALHRGHEVSVVTRGENHIRQARDLGAAWAGSDFRDLPGKADGAVLFAPSGKLVPPTLEALDRGGACSIAGIHLSDVPSLDYNRHLYQERELRSVTANTREDARAAHFLMARAGRESKSPAPFQMGLLREGVVPAASSRGFCDQPDGPYWRSGKAMSGSPQGMYNRQAPGQ
jgi:alcohol dehydrogenase, propanol-preferring